MKDRFADLKITPDHAHLPCTSGESAAMTEDTDMSSPYTHVTPEEKSYDEGAAQSRRQSPLLRCVQSQKGVLLTLLSTIFFALQAVVVSYLKDDLSSTVILAIRCYLIFTIVLPLIVLSGIPIVGPKRDLKFLIIRSFLGSVNLALKYFAYQNMKIGDASAIFFATPAFTGIFGRIFLKEPFHKLEMLVVVLSIIGVVIVSQPPFLFLTDHGEIRNTPAGIVSAVASMLLTSILFILLRAMGKRNIRPFQTMIYFSIIGAIMLTTFNTASSSWVVPPCGSTRYILLGLGGLGFCGQLLITYVLMVEKAVIVSITRSNEVLLAFLFEFVVLGVAPSLLSCLGSVLIVSSILMLLSKKMLQGRRNPVREDVATKSGEADTQT